MKRSKRRLVIDLLLAFAVLVAALMLKRYLPGLLAWLHR
jgi:hypothetical protein